MVDLSSFEIAQRWPTTNPHVIQFYSLIRADGKVSAMLEVTGMAHRIPSNSKRTSR
jgi:hypothetical protein